MKKMSVAIILFATFQLRAMDISTLEEHYQNLQKICVAHYARIEQLTGIQKACVPFKKMEDFDLFVKLNKDITALYMSMLTLQNSMKAINLEYQPLMMQPLALRLSRFPRANEIPAASSFIKFAASLGISIDMVRFVDSRSLISAMPLGNEKKQKLLSLLNEEPEKVFPAVSEFFDKWQFEDSMLRKTVLRFEEKGCESSNTFRHMLIAMAAKNELDRISFYRREKHSTISNTIMMGLQGDPEHLRTFFFGPHALYACGDGSYAYSKKDYKSLFHEGGHMITQTLVKDASMDDVCAVISKMATLDIDQEYCECCLAKLSVLSLLEQEEFVRTANMMCKTSFKDVGEFDGFVRNLYLQRWGAALAAYHNAAEILQILGFTYLRVEDKNVLFVNLLSDLTLSLESGCPIRYSHLAADQAQNAVSIQRINYGMLNVLFALHGHSLDGYVSRLLFGKNLLAYQARELGLAKSSGQLTKYRSWEDFWRVKE